MPVPKIFCLALFVMALFVGAMDSLAQDPVRLRAEDRLYQLPVDERTPSDYSNPGKVFRGFNYKTSLKLQNIYDTNVYAQNENEVSDFILKIQPSITVKKDVRDHVFMVGARGEARRYASLEGENAEDFSVFGRGSLVATKQIQIPFGIEFEKDVRQRSAPVDTVLTKEPTSTERFKSSLGLVKTFNRLSVSATGQYTQTASADARGLENNERIVYSDNDKQIYALNLGARYALKRGEGVDKGHVIYTDVTFGDQVYKNRQFENGTQSYSGLKGDRKTVNALIGFETDYKGIIFANIAGGVIRQEFEEPSLERVQNYDFNGEIEWNATQRMTLGFTTGRTINQENGFVQGVLQTDYKALLDYEIYHDLYFNSSLGLSLYDFQEDDRMDTVWSSGVGLRYLHSRFLESNFGVNYATRDTDEPTNEFDGLLFMIGLTGKF